MSVQPPKPPDGAGQSLSDPRICFCGPLQSSSQVVMIVFKFIEPVGRSSGLQLRFSLFAKRAVVLRVQAVHLVFVATLPECLKSELAKDFEHLTARIFFALIPRCKKVVFYERRYAV